MSADPRKLEGAAALRAIVERLKTSGAGGAHTGRSAGKRPPSLVAPRRPLRAPSKQVEPLVDVHFDGVQLIVTTETDDADPQVSVEAARLILRTSGATERAIALPCRVQPHTLRVHVVNGVLEATMAPENLAP